MRPVLFVIDMQTEYLSYIKREERTKLISNNIDMIDYCAENDIPILYFEHFECDSPTNRDVRKAIENSKRNIFIRKYRDGAFSTRKTNKYLKEVEADCTIMTGINLSACLLDTAVGSVRNYETLAACDLTADGKYAVDWAIENNRHALEWLDSHCKLFETHEELMEYLDRRINYKLKLSAL